MVINSVCFALPLKMQGWCLRKDWQWLAGFKLQHTCCYKGMRSSEDRHAVSDTTVILLCPSNWLAINSADLCSNTCLAVCSLTMLLG